MNTTVPQNFNVAGWELGNPQPNWTFTEIPDQMNVANASSYILDYESRFVLGAALSSGLQGSVNADPEKLTIDFNADNVTNALDAAIIQEMWMSANSSETMSARVQKIADAYTAYMQTDLSAALDERYAPTSFSETIIVVVRWPWLAYPLALVLAGYTFLAATLLQTQRCKIRAWKGQRLPLLLADVDDSIRRSAGGGGAQPGVLEERVGRIRVQIQCSKQGAVLAFKRVNEHDRRRRPGSSESRTELLLSASGEGDEKSPDQSVAMCT